jgi:hypothetical protein
MSSNAAFNNWQLAQKPALKPAAYFDADTLGNRLDNVISLLEAFVAPSPANQTQSTPAQAFGTSTAAKTPFQLSPTPTVKIAYLQNISSVAITKGVLSTMQDGVGFILNAASAAGSAGDSQVIGPQGTDSFVDLSKYWFTANTTGVVLVCDYLQ